jgi:HKD family nuclease
MKIEFLGHGIFEEQDNTVGNYLHKSFKDKNFDTFKCFVAYTTLSGLSIFIDELEKVILNYKKIEFYLGVDDNGTSREALLELLEKEIDTYIYYNPTKRTRAIYHPKLYIFNGEKANRILIGSSNLTRPGLFNNVETSLAIDFVSGNFQGEKLKRQIEEYFFNFLDKSNQNIKKLDLNLIKYLTVNGLILDEKRIYESEEDIEKNNIKDDEGNDLFTAVEASYLDLEDLENIASQTEIKNYQSKIILNDYYFSTWKINFDRFKIFKEKYKSVIIPKDYVNRGLYTWYLNQKALYREERIPEEHLEKLLKNGFNFASGHDIRFDKIWEESYLELKEYFLKFKNSDVPRKKDSKDPLYKLSNFVAMQRHYKKYDDNRMSEYKIKKLEEIDFSWELGYKRNGQISKDDDQWFINLTIYSEFKKKYNREPKQKRNTDEYKIARWRNDQTVNRKRGLLSQDRIELLESENIIWDLEEHEFKIKLNKLLDYKKEFGNFNVPLSYKTDGIALGNFIYSLKNRGTRKEYKEILEEIGVDGIILRSEVDRTDKKYRKLTLVWKNNFEKLKALKEKGENINQINQDYQEDKKFGTWVSSQKRRYTFENLNDEQIQLLENLGLKLSKENSTDEKWNLFYDLLCEYKISNGNCRVTKSFDKELYTWSASQRRAKRIKTLTPEKIAKLEEIEFEWELTLAPNKKNVL